MGVNGHVYVCSNEYLLHAGHSFDDNGLCELHGAPATGSVPALGCVESGPCLMAPLIVSGVTADGGGGPENPATPPSFGCGVSHGQGMAPALLLLALLGLCRRRTPR